MNESLKLRVRSFDWGGTSLGPITGWPSSLRAVVKALLASRYPMILTQRNSLRLLKLVNTLLDFARIEAGRVRARYEPADLAALTADLASVFRAAVEAAGLELVIDCPPLPAPVWVDRDMWEKIVLNLLSNAFKFTERGSIRIRQTVVDERVELAVEDTGSGIPAEEIGRIFDRFHRVEGARGAPFRARSETEAASRLKDEFLSTVSHELRTPLNAVLGWTQLLRQSGSADKTLADGLEIIERNARAQNRLIEDLLDLGGAVSGRVRLDMQPTDLAAVVEAAIETLQPMAGSRRVRVAMALDPEVGPVAGDPGRLQQVVTNLLSNALKFTLEGGEVRLTLRRSGAFAELAVGDTGIGIEPDFLPHVFDRFRQADGSTSRMYGGLGIGLSIVKHLVELHGGTVRVESAGTDQGTTFTVALPLAGARFESRGIRQSRPADHSRK